MRRKSGWGKEHRDMVAAAENDKARRRRLLWRATHRGIREMDILFGGFVARGIDGFTEAELSELERMVALSDQELLAWATLMEPVPTTLDGPLLRAMLAFQP